MTNEIYSIGQWVRHRRKTLDMTQQGLADRAHCSINTIKKIETDSRRPSRQLALILAEQLELTEEKHALFVDVARGLRSVESLLDKAVPEMRFAPDPQPVSLPKIIGRASELATLRRLIQESRIVTITGPGGVGKSSLAQAFISESQKQREKAIFISLVGVNDVDHIPFSVATALGLDVPFDTDPLDQILSYLSNKRIILILDNFEHLLDGTWVLGKLLQSASGVKLIVTSRERLHLPDEQNLPLRGLRYPEDAAFTESITEYPAFELFLNCARKINPDFSTEDRKSLIDICRLTDGLPLALEMLASWTDVLPVKDILPELTRDLDLLAHEYPQEDMRHHSMRTVFEASWRMLTETEREVFAWMCVFRGGVTRQAAEAVAGASLGVLSALVGRSMIKLDLVSGRYSVHGLLQLFGEEYLKNSGTFDKVQLEHAEYFSKQAGDFRSFLHGPQQQEVFDHLDAEQDNVRAALTFLFSLPDRNEQAGQMVLALCWYWRIRSRVVEARKWVERALEIKPISVETRARLYFHAGHFDWMQGNYDSARVHQEECLKLCKKLGAVGSVIKAYALNSLGMIACVTEEYSSAEKYFLESIELFEQADEPWGLAFSWKWLGVNYLRLGNIESAKSWLSKAEDYFRTCEDEWVLGLVLGFRAWIELDTGNFSKAKALADEAREIRESLGHTHSIIDSLEILVEIAINQGDREEARRLCSSAMEIAEELGNEEEITRFNSKLVELSEQ